MSGSPQTPVSPAAEETAVEQSRARHPHPLPESIGPYRIIEVIGEGGMGIVYKGEQRDPVRRVAAIKVIKLGMDTKEIVARFDTERQALALMSHPNVAKVFEAGMTEQGRPYFAMEFVPGVPITHYCDTQKLTTRERLELFIPVCQAVQHAHQKGIIHRDLKPGNILVTLVDGKPVPKVIDFGVAKATSVQLTQHTLHTQAGTVIGTLEYMSPEQATSSGLDVDTRTDIYSLGVILYQLLTGALPFESDTLRKAPRDKFADIIQNTDPPRPSARLTEAGTSRKPDTTEIARRRGTDLRILRREVRGDLDWIVLKAIEKDRTRRYETASGLAMDLRRHLADEPVLARPPSTAYKVRKFVRRHRVNVAAAAAILLTFIIGTAATGYGLFQRRVAHVERSLREIKEIEAENSLKTANHVSGLFQEVLLPITSDGIRRTPVQIFDDAARRLDARVLADDPAIEARTREVLGQRMAAIGLYQHAIPQFRAALSLNKHLRPADSPELVSLLNEFADALVINGNLDEADPVLNDAILIESMPGYPDRAARARTMDLRGSVLVGRGELSVAEPLLEEALKIRQTTPGDSLDMADSLAHLGDLYRRTGNPDGQAFLDRARQMYTRVFSLQPLAMIGPMRHLARSAANRGDWTNWNAADETFSQSNLFAVPQELGLLGDWINAITTQLNSAQFSSGPQNLNFLARRGGFYARRGEFELAAADGDKVLDADSDRYRVWHWCLPTYLQIGRVEQFRKMRHKALLQFKTRQDAQIAHMIAKSALCFPFDPADAEDRETATTMAENAVRLSLQPKIEFDAQNPTLRSLQGVSPFYVQSLGMAEYRAGRFPSAILLMNSTRDHVYVYRDALADFYIAMAHARRGDSEEARSALATGIHLWTSSAPGPGIDDLEQFQDWIICNQARIEASAMIHER